MTETKNVSVLFYKNLIKLFYMNLKFDSEVSLHYWMLWLTARRLADAAALLAATAAPPPPRSAEHLEHCALGGAGSRQLMEIGQGSTTTTHPIIVFPSNKTENCRQNVSD